MATILLEVATPDKGEVFSKEINMLIVRSICGELGILPKHARLLTELTPHAMRIKESGGETQLFVSGGFMEVTRLKIPTTSTLTARRRLTNAQANVSTRKTPKLTSTAQRRHLPERRRDFWLKAFIWAEQKNFPTRHWAGIFLSLKLFAV